MLEAKPSGGVCARDRIKAHSGHVVGPVGCGFWPKYAISLTDPGAAEVVVAVSRGAVQLVNGRALLADEDGFF
jgi:hypothetical protein